MARSFRFRLKTRRPRARFTSRRKRWSRRTSRSRKSIYNPLRRVKKARRFNKGRLRLQRALTRGASLPKETSTRVYWRGSGVIDLNAQYQRGGPSTQYIMQDQAYCLDRLGGPVFFRPDSISTAFPKGLMGKIAYADVWTSLYTEGLVTGSKLKVTIRNPLYPSLLTYLRNEDATSNYARLPPNLMYGFWYIRYYYSRYLEKPGTMNPIVGHPIFVPSTTQHWSNMRDFMSDTTVTWVRDRLPRATKLHFERDFADPDSGSVKQDDDLFPMRETANPRVSYEVQYSNKPITLIASFSRKKHFQQSVADSHWEPITNLGVVADYQNPTPIAPRMYVMIGYIGFDGDGSVCHHAPADRIPNKQIEVQWMARIRLRTPKEEPWDATLKPYSMTAPAAGVDAGGPVEEDNELTMDGLELSDEEDLDELEEEDELEQ